jgi:hypothetical protein
MNMNNNINNIPSIKYSSNQDDDGDDDVNILSSNPNYNVQGSLDQQPI